MNRYKLWVRISPTQTTNTFIYADNVIAAKLLGEAQYGKGNVLTCWIL